MRIRIHSELVLVTIMETLVYLSHQRHTITQRLTLEHLVLELKIQKNLCFFPLHSVESQFILWPAFSNSNALFCFFVSYEQNYFTLLYFTCTLPALPLILVVTFEVTRGKVQKVMKSHDGSHTHLKLQYQLHSRSHPPHIHSTYLRKPPKTSKNHGHTNKAPRNNHGLLRRFVASPQPNSPP